MGSLHAPQRLHFLGAIIKVFLRFFSSFSFPFSFPCGRFSSLLTFYPHLSHFLFLSCSHVDHMRFSCLPAALEMDILMAFRVRRSQSSPQPTVDFRLENTSHRFQATSFQSHVDSEEGVQLDHSGPGRWANYFKVAFKVSCACLSVPRSDRLA